MKKKIIQLVMTVALCAGAAVTSAAPWIGLVKTGSTTQTNDFINVGTSTYNFDVRLNSGGYSVGTLLYSFYTDPANAITFGATPVTALNSPFTSSDLSVQPAAGSTLNVSNNTQWFKISGGDYAAFVNNVATYQINTSTLTSGVYVISFNTNSSEQLYQGGTNQFYAGDFQPVGSFVLDIVSVPEPGTWALLAAGGLVMGWKIRRRLPPRA